MADSAPVIIWTSDTDKLSTFFNKLPLQFTGRSVDEELGTERVNRDPGPPARKWADLPEGDYVPFSVSDTGCGMSAEI